MRRKVIQKMFQAFISNKNTYTRHFNTRIIKRTCPEKNL